MPQSQTGETIQPKPRWQANREIETVIHRCKKTELVISLFPGVGLFDRAFRESGFCVCAGPDLITGGDVREFVGVPGRFDGLVAGPPCQGFSVANSHRGNDKHASVQNSREMLRHTVRLITEFSPEWFLIENVPAVPDVRIDGYEIQRIPISDFECGGRQLRLRHVQFGSKSGDVIRPQRVNDSPQIRRKGRPGKAVTTKSEQWRDFPDVCRRQGLSQPLTLPGWYRTAKIKAVGNGVPLSIGRVLAAAVLCRARRDPAADCICGCGRIVSARAASATAACRKRLQIARERARPYLDISGFHE